ncbi:hypothetical protein OPL79_002489 [Enterococcus faecalis]|nr:hypothetical protein [Enterococcus faecalis]
MKLKHIIYTLSLGIALLGTSATAHAEPKITEENDLFFLQKTEDTYPEINTGNRINQMPSNAPVYQWGGEKYIENWRTKKSSFYKKNYGSSVIEVQKNEPITLFYKNSTLYRGKISNTRITLSDIVYKKAKGYNFNYPVVSLSNNFFSGFVFGNTESFKMKIEFLNQQGEVENIGATESYITFNSLYPQGEYVGYLNNPADIGIRSDRTFVQYDQEQNYYIGGKPNRDFVDQIGHPTYKDSSVMFRLTRSSQEFIGGNKGAFAFWFTPSSLVLGDDTVEDKIIVQTRPVDEAGHPIDSTNTEFPKIVGNPGAEKTITPDMLPETEGYQKPTDPIKFILPITSDTVFDIVYKKNVLVGDINGDGKISLLDLAILKNYLDQKTLPSGISETDLLRRADMNGDGKISLLDLAILKIKIDQG